LQQSQQNQVAALRGDQDGIHNKEKVKAIPRVRYGSLRRKLMLAEERKAPLGINGRYGS